MKIFNWIQKNKYPLMVTMFFIMVLLLLFVLLQALRKDHSMELTIQKLELKEEARQAIEKERAAWEELVKQKDQSIQQLAVKDSLTAVYVDQLNGQIDNLSKRYNDKAKIINTYGSDELREYFRNLPKQPDNDY